MNIDCNINPNIKSNTLKNLYIGDNISYVEDYFMDDNLSKIVLGKNVSQIKDFAFNKALVSEFTITGEQTPICDPNIFGTSDLWKATLYAPKTKLDYYQTTEPWSKFGTIIGIESSGIESVKDRGIAIQSAGGFINISGLDNNEKVSFYGLDGKALGSATAIDGKTSFSAQSGTVVVAKIGRESIKIAVE